MKKRQEHSPEMVSARLTAQAIEDLKFRAIFEHSGTAIVIIDQEGIYHLVNSLAAKYFCCTSEEMSGSSILDFIPAETALKYIERNRRRIESGLGAEYEDTFQLPSGTHTFLITDQVLKDRQGNGYAILSSSIDITERKLAEQALLESEQTVRKKLEAVLSPDGDFGALNLADIIDAQAIQAIMDDFYTLTHIGVGLIDLNGKVLVASGWQDVCTKYHRFNPETRQNCLESDTVLTLGGLPGEFKAYKCKNHLWDISTPIVVGGKHLGNIFLGQFFYEDETPDYETFRIQARKYGFDEQAYLAAIDRVPRWSYETVECVMRFYSHLSSLISDLSYSNLKLAQTLDERNKILEQLDSNYALLRIAGETAKFGGWFLDLDSKKVVWSDTVAAIHEMPAGSFPLLDEGINFYLPEWRDKITKAVAGCAEKGIPYDEEMEIVTTKGNRKWVRTTGEAVRDGNGKIFRLQGSFQDVTERKKIEKKLYKSEAIFNQFMEHSPIYVFFKDENIRSLRLSRNFEEMLGKNMEELLGKSMDDLFPSDLAKDMIENDQQILKKGVKIEIEEEFNNRQYSTIKFPIQVEGEPKFLAGFTIDITDRKKSEKAMKESELRLQELNAAKDKLFSIIAHDLKSPFNSILGFSDILLERTQENDYEGLAEYAEIIRDSAQHAMDLLMNLLDWSLSQTGRMEFNPTRLNIGELISEATKLLTNIVQQKSIGLTIELPSEGMAFADRKMIGTILRNLLSNAIKFTHPGGRIIIHADKKLGEWVISVSDNGVGITEDSIQKLFRIDENNTTPGTQNEKGTGLGLMLCNEFVEKHGGKIWVESEVDKGSTFYFSIPNLAEGEK